jgi:hypothetical protein
MAAIAGADTIGCIASLERTIDSSVLAQLPIPAEVARRSGMMPPTDSEMISPTVPR